MRVHEGSAQRPRSLETMFVFNESLSDHFIAFVFPWLLRMLWIQFDFMMNFIENEFHWIRNCYACFEHNSTSWWTSLKNEFRWIRETRSLRTMCVKVITMTLRILLLWLAAGALRGTRTYPNPWRAFLFCLPFLSFFLLTSLSFAFKTKMVERERLSWRSWMQTFSWRRWMWTFQWIQNSWKMPFWQNSWKIWIMNCDFEEVLFQTSPNYCYYERPTYKKRCFALQT